MAPVSSETLGPSGSSASATAIATAPDVIVTLHTPQVPSGATTRPVGTTS